MNWYKRANNSAGYLNLKVQNDRINVQKTQQQLMQLNQQVADVRSQMGQSSDEDQKRELAKKEQELQKQIGLLTKQMPVQQGMMQMDQQDKAQLGASPKAPVAQNPAIKPPTMRRGL